MAEDADESQKTEEPTDKKLTDARKKGQVAQSQEVKSWGVLLGGTIAIALLGPWTAGKVRDVGIFAINNSYHFPTDFEALRLGFYELALQVFIILSPIMGILILMAIAANMGQVGLMWSPEKIKPDPSKLSLIKGVKRVVSVRQFVEFLKGIFKLLIVGVVAFGVSIPLLSDLALIPDKNLVVVLERIMALVLSLSAATVGVLTAIAALDFIYQKYTFTKQMRMTKQEVKDEHKQSEGDPQVKSRIRKLRIERAVQRMFANLPQADVVVTNPTHYAVAMEYKMDTMPAPKLVAKGVDHIAHRIREVAEEHDIPIVENPPLARALYAAVEIDEEIPPEHYVAVAEVIGYVMRMRGNKPA